MKKLLSMMFVLLFELVSFCGVSIATNFQNQDTSALPGVPKVPTAATTDVFDDTATGSTATALLDGIKLAINRVLGLLALIALIVLIYTGVMMLINARDSKKVEEGYGVVRNVAIALVFIGVSWLVVSFIFWAIGVFTGP